MADHPWLNKLYYGDNLDWLPEIATESVDLVYLDPPFNSNRNYNVIFGRERRAGGGASAQIQAFDDTWHWTPVTDEQYGQYAAGLPMPVSEALRAFHAMLGENDAMAYLVNMAPRLVELRRVLKRTGSLYLHCDPTMSHYLKILLDATFNPAWFRNEIIWRRTAVKGDARTRFGRNHDILLYYAAGERPAFSPQATEHTEDYRARFRFDDHDGRGSYRDGPLDSPNPRPNLTYEYKDYPPPHNGWRVSREEMERLDADGRLIFPKDPEARIMRKLYLREREGVPMGDVWTDIAPINSQAVERLGYPTQKPAALLERILRASSADGDVVLDPFCGCGTTVDVAQRLGRRWIGIDITFIAVDLINKRLRDRFPGIDNYETFGIPRDLEGAEDLAKRRPFDFEWWAVSLVGAQPHEKHKQRGDRGIDGVALFDTDGRRKEFGRMLVSVKGGEKVMPTAVRDLLGTVETEKAQMGVLILRTKP